MYALVYVSNIWSVPYLHDNVVLMLVSFLTFCRLVRIVNCLSSPSASMSYEKRCWGGDATAWCVCVCVCVHVMMVSVSVVILVSASTQIQISVLLSVCASWKTNPCDWCCFGMCVCGCVYVAV